MFLSRRRVVWFCLALVVMGTASGASALDPESFAEVASGVVFIKATGCGPGGGGSQSGSGFFVGTSVVVTASHVVKGCRSVRVLVEEKTWIRVASFTSWSDTGVKLDVATLKLAVPAPNAFIFYLRKSQIPIGGYVAALGHPLGEAVSMVNGRVLARIAGQRLVLRMLGAQGMSGGPIVDSYGQVVALVNAGFGDPGVVTGAVTGDNLICYDLSSRWGGWRRTLCQAYPTGGIGDC